VIRRGVNNPSVVGGPVARVTSGLLIPGDDLNGLDGNLANGDTHRERISFIWLQAVVGVRSGPYRG